MAKLMDKQGILDELRRRAGNDQQEQTSPTDKQQILDELRKRASGQKEEAPVQMAQKPQQSPSAKDEYIYTVGKAGWADYQAQQEKLKNQPKTEPKKKTFWQSVLEGVAGIGSDTTLPGVGGSQVTTMSKEAQQKDTELAAPKDSWTDDERYAFGYLWNTQRQKAWEYARAVNEAYAQAEETKAVEKAKQEASKNFGSGLANTAGAVAASPFGLADMLQDFISYGATGRIQKADGELSPFEWSQAATQGISEKLNEKGGTISEKVPVIGGKGWGDVYGVGTSLANSLVAAYTGGPGQALIVNFGPAVASAMDDALSRGATDEQAMGYGFLSGLAEAAAEMVGVDNLLKLGAADSLKAVMKNLLKQGTTEALEEGLTSAIDQFADNLILRDKSVLNRTIADYMAQGMNQAQAQRRAWLDMAEGVAADMLAGFLSGAAGGGVETIVQTVPSKMKENAQYKAVYGTEVGALIEEALELNPDNALAQKLKKAVESGKTVSGRDISRLVAANEAEIQKLQENSAEGMTAEAEQQSGQEAMQEDPELTLQKEIERQWDSRYEQDSSAHREPEAAQDIRNDQNTGAADNAESLSAAARLRQQEEGNGGTQYVSENKQTQRLIPSDAGAGAGVSDGGSQRYAGQSAGEQAGILASSTAQRRNTAADRSREAVARQNLARSLRLEKVSSADLGLQSGTENRNIQVMPQEHWDSEMTELADRIYEETGKNVTYVVGRIQIRGSSGNVAYARGVITGDRIIVQADNFGLSMQQIADHEAYHAKANFAAENRLNLNNEIRRHIVRTYSKEQFQKVMEKYIVGLSGVIDVNAAHTGEEYEAALRQIEEEIFADAYAGINAFGANADQFTEAVNEKMDQLGMGKIRKQENGVRETNGPPAVLESSTDARYSINESFPDIVDSWYQGGMQTGESFNLGSTGEVFQGLGAVESDIYMLGDKIKTILTEHPEMTIGEIKKIPQILEDPILILKSKGVGRGNRSNTRLVVFGSVAAQNGQPILTVLDLRPVENNLVIDDMQKVSSAYTKGTDPTGFVSNSKVLYADKKRTAKLLRTIGFQAPIELQQSGYIGSIYYRGQNVNIDGADFADVFGAVKERSFQTVDGLSAKAGMQDGTTSFVPGEPKGGRIVKESFSYDEDTNDADMDALTIDEMDAKYGPQLQFYVDPNLATEEIDGNIRQVARMDPVAKITGEEFAKGEKDLITQVEEFFGQLGNAVYNGQLGDVVLDRRGIKSDIAHGIGRKKAAAFAAVPEVISQGRIVDYQKNWKGRGYDTAVVAAPIKIGEEDYIAAAVLTRSNQTNRFYVHEVLTMKNGAMPFKTGTQKKGTPGGDAPSVFSILDKIRSVKNETSIEERFSLDEGAQQNEEQKTATKEKQRPVAESRPLIAKKDLRNTMLSLFSVPDGSRAELGTVIDNYADRLIKNGTLTEADRKAFFDRMYESGVMTMPANENYAEARSYLKDSRIYVPESVVADFGDDWSDIRRRAFASGIYLTRSRSSDGHSIAGIDVWNSDLAGELPGLFNAEETDQRSILERIVQVAEEGKDENMSLAEYTARLAESEHQSEAEFLDNMERQMDWALRTFAEKARLEVHLRDRTGRKIAQERQKHQESAQLARDRKELRQLQEKTLKQLQWLSKNRNRAPEELRATWDEVLGDIDLYAIGAANEMRWSDKYNATWKDLVEMYDKAKAEDPNFFESKELERFVARLRYKKLEDLDIDALDALYKLATGLRTKFYNQKNVINDEMQRLFAEVYTDSKREIESAPGENSAQKGKVSGWADKFLNMDQLTPMNVLQRMAGWDPDGAFYSMAKQLERGERDMRAYHVKAQKMLQDFLTEHEDWVKKADGQGKDGLWYKIEIPELVALELGKTPQFGGTIEVWMTPMQKIHMYLESKNQDNLRHMTGGRTFADKQIYSEGKRQEAFAQGKTVRMAPETVKAIVKDLTAEEMELAQILDRYYNTFATQEINKVSNILYGYDKAMGKNYAPIYTNRNYTKTEFGVFDTTAEGVGNLKGRQYAVNPSYNISAFDAFERHVDQAARFCGMAIPARNWTNLMNWREKSNSMGDVITHKWGEEGKRYITDLITTLQAGDDAKNDTISSGLSKLQSNYITAIFGANPSIVLKQLGSIPMAGAYLDVKNLPTPAQIAKIDRGLISKYTQELEWRTMGYATPETKQLKENPNWTQTNKTFKFVFGGGAITAMDGWAASTLWPWAENKVRREYPELEVGTQAQVEAGESPFYKKVAEEFENAITRSQSVSDEIHQSSLRKSKNPLTRTFTMFRSDSAQTYNTLRQKIGEAQYYARTGEKEQVLSTAKKAVGTAFMAMLLNAAWGESINFLMALWKNKGKYYRNDEDEMTFASVAGEMVSGMLGSFAGVVTGGEEVLEIIGNILTGEKIYDIETPGMEQLNDLIDTVTTTCGGMREVVAGGWDVLKNGGNLGEHFRKNSGKILGSIKDLAVAAATYLPGLPASNLEVYLVGAVKWLSPELGTAYEDLFSNVGKGDLSGLKGEALHSRVNGILSDRRVSESNETAGVLAALYEAGYKTAIPSDTPESVSIDGEKHTLGVYQKQTYDMIWGSIVADALDEIVVSDSFKAADQKSQAKMLSDLYTYAAEQAKSELFDGFETGGFTKRVDALKNEGKELADAIVLASKYGDAAVDDYLQMTDAGMDQKTAEGLLDEIEELEPLAGKEKVQDVQRWRTCVDFSGNEAIQLAGLAGQMQASQFAKVQIAHSFGVTPDAYVGYYEIREKFDTDHSGSYSNAEVQAAIDSMSSYGLTNSEKAVLWQLATGSKSAKNNPYSVEVGEKVLAAKQN